jgi:hypothetical protein
MYSPNPHGPKLQYLMIPSGPSYRLKDRLKPSNGGGALE